VTYGSGRSAIIAKSMPSRGRAGLHYSGQYALAPRMATGAAKYQCAHFGQAIVNQPR
jgi:hypothetical protein